MAQRAANHNSSQTRNYRRALRGSLYLVVVLGTAGHDVSQTDVA
jgi:hypothetical protein